MLASKVSKTCPLAELPVIGKIVEAFISSIDFGVCLSNADAEEAPTSLEAGVDCFGSADGKSIGLGLSLSFPGSPLFVAAGLESMVCVS
jgi:hypothetical protein